MTYELNRAIQTASHNLRFVTKGYIERDELVSQLETIKRIAPFSSVVTRATCQKFCSDCNVLSKRLFDDGEYDSAYDMLRIAMELFDDCVKWCRIAGHAEKMARRDWDRGDVESVRIARWESKGGKYWVDLYHGRFDYRYGSNNSGGSVCSPFVDNESAVMVAQAMVDNGQFLPDNAIFPMRRMA